MAVRGEEGVGEEGGESLLEAEGRVVTEAAGEGEGVALPEGVAPALSLQTAEAVAKLPVALPDGLRVAAAVRDGERDADELPLSEARTVPDAEGVPTVVGETLPGGVAVAVFGAEGGEEALEEDDPVAPALCVGDTGPLTDALPDVERDASGDAEGVEVRQRVEVPLNDATGDAVGAAEGVPAPVGGAL